jgi:hypothetical protein
LLTTGSGEFSAYNFPNPFNNTTEIVYTLPEQGHVNLTVTNIYGVVIGTLVNTDQAAGSYTVKVNPSDLNMKSGIYMFQIQVNGVNHTYTTARSRGVGERPAPRAHWTWRTAHAWRGTRSGSPEDGRPRTGVESCAARHVIHVVSGLCSP